MPKITLDDGRVFEQLDKTHPLAAKDHFCNWTGVPEHVIRKGEKYVRIVFKIDDGDIESRQYCLRCWNELMDRVP